MTVNVFLYATLRRFVPDYDPYQGMTLEIAPGTTVARVISDLGLPRKEIKLILINGCHQEADYTLQGRERIGLFPPIGGG